VAGRERARDDLVDRPAHLGEARSRDVERAQRRGAPEPTHERAARRAEYRGGGRRHPARRRRDRVGQARSSPGRQCPLQQRQRLALVVRHRQHDHLVGRGRDALDALRIGAVRQHRLLDRAVVRDEAGHAVPDRQSRAHDDPDPLARERREHLGSRLERPGAGLERDQSVRGPHRRDQLAQVAGRLGDHRVDVRVGMVGYVPRPLVPEKPVARDRPVPLRVQMELHVVAALDHLRDRLPPQRRLGAQTP
jgi:hypothetical protein